MAQCSAQPSYRNRQVPWLDLTRGLPHVFCSLSAVQAYQTYIKYNMTPVGQFHCPKLYASHYYLFCLVQWSTWCNSSLFMPTGTRHDLCIMHSSHWVCFEDNTGCQRSCCWTCHQKMPSGLWPWSDRTTRHHWRHQCKTFVYVFDKRQSGICVGLHNMSRLTQKPTKWRSGQFQEISVWNFWVPL